MIREPVLSALMLPASKSMLAMNSIFVTGNRGSKMVGLSELSTGRLDTDRTCAVKVPKLMSAIKVPSIVKTGKRPAEAWCAVADQRGLLLVRV